MKEIILSSEEKNIESKPIEEHSNFTKDELLNKLHSVRNLSGYEIKVLLEHFKDS